jgi:GxxExxY protein
LHQSVGPGLLESVYEAILARDLMRRGLKMERQKLLRFEYDGMVFEEGLRLDLLVDDRVIVELKSVETIHPVPKKQLLTYLRLAHQPVGAIDQLRSGNTQGRTSSGCEQSRPFGFIAAESQSRRWQPA